MHRRLRRISRRAELLLRHYLTHVLDLKPWESDGVRLDVHINLCRHLHRSLSRVRARVRLRSALALAMLALPPNVLAWRRRMAADRLRPTPPAT